MPKNFKLIDTLKTEFDRDAKLKQVCVQSSKEKIHQHIANRIFDEFPVFIEKNAFKALIEEFKLLLKNPTRETVREFEKIIISAACDELLDDKDNINKNLIDLLEWNESLSQIDNRNVVCAFVGMVTACIAKESISESQEMNDKFIAVADCINKNYSKWISDVMREKGLKYNPIYDTDKVTVIDIISYPIKNPGFGVALFFGGLLGAALYGGYKKLKDNAEDTSPLEKVNYSKLE